VAALAARFGGGTRKKGVYSSEIGDRFQRILRHYFPGRAVPAARPRESALSGDPQWVCMPVRAPVGEPAGSWPGTPVVSRTSPGLWLSINIFSAWKTQVIHRFSRPKKLPSWTGYLCTKTL